MSFLLESPALKYAYRQTLFRIWNTHINRKNTKKTPWLQWLWSYKTHTHTQLCTTASVSNSKHTQSTDKNYVDRQLYVSYMCSVIRLHIWFLQSLCSTARSRKNSIHDTWGDSLLLTLGFTTAWTLDQIMSETINPSGQVVGKSNMGRFLAAVKKKQTCSVIGWWPAEDRGMQNGRSARLHHLLSNWKNEKPERWCSWCSGCDGPSDAASMMGLTRCIEGLWDVSVLVFQTHLMLTCGHWKDTVCVHVGALRCVFGAVVAAVDITFILLSRVLKALFRSGVFSDGETACHCRGEFRLSAQPTDNMLGWEGGRARHSWVRVEGGGEWGRMGRNGADSLQAYGLWGWEPQKGMGGRFEGRWVEEEVLL